MKFISLKIIVCVLLIFFPAMLLISCGEEATILIINDRTVTVNVSVFHGFTGNTGATSFSGHLMSSGNFSLQPEESKAFRVSGGNARYGVVVAGRVIWAGSLSRGTTHTVNIR